MTRILGSVGSFLFVFLILLVLLSLGGKADAWAGGAKLTDHPTVTTGGSTAPADPDEFGFKGRGRTTAPSARYWSREQNSWHQRMTPIFQDLNDLFDWLFGGRNRRL